MTTAPAGSSEPSAPVAPGVMSDVEYARMDELEAEHWWYAGLRDLIARILARYQIAQRADVHVLDAGCGTGENLRMCAEKLPAARLCGFDASEQAVRYAQRKVPQADLYLSDVCQPQLRQQQYDVILSCDVLQITGFDATRAGMRQVAAQLKPDGVMIMNLPAYQWLYSQHDVAVSTRFRFTAGKVRAFLSDIGLRPQLVTYRLCALFPLVVLARLPCLRRRASSADAPPSDLTATPRWLNAALTSLLQCENALISRGLALPWGSSVFAVARRR